MRLRVAGRCPDRRSADLIGDHVRQLNMQGPYAAGGPVNLGREEVIAVDAVLIPRAWVKPEIVMVDKDTSMSVRVHDLAHARSGDKGNTSNVAVIAYDDAAWLRASSAS